MTSILTDSIQICFENPQESSRIVENRWESLWMQRSEGVVSAAELQIADCRRLSNRWTLTWATWATWATSPTPATRSLINISAAKGARRRKLIALATDFVSFVSLFLPFFPEMIHCIVLQLNSNSINSFPHQLSIVDQNWQMGKKLTINPFSQCHCKSLIKFISIISISIGKLANWQIGKELTINPLSQFHCI